MHSNVGLKLPIPALIADGWYQPLQLSPEAEAKIDKSMLVEGVTSIDGKLYSFPIFNSRQYWAAIWFNKELVEKAGMDPANPPQTYDEFRAAAKTAQDKSGDAYGWINNLGQPERIAEQTHFMAQAAGFGGNLGQDFKTGDFVFHSDPYVGVIEFMLSLQKDGLLMPGTNNMNDKVARARWATGSAVYYMDGQWCAGVVKQDMARFSDKLDVGPMLVPDKGTPVTSYRGPQGGAFWVSGKSGKAVGGETAERSLRAVKRSGRIAWPNGVDPVPATSPVAMVSYYDGDRSRSAAERLNAIIGTSAFETHVARTFALEQVKDAHLALRDHYVGKLALRIAPPESTS